MFEPTPLFNQLLNQFKSGHLSPEACRLRQPVTPPAAGDIHDVRTLSPQAKAEFAALGQAALAERQVGAIVLAGGMATRFAYTQPKGLFPILGEDTFLALKIENLKAHGVPLYLMTSFHTHAAIMAYLEAHDYFGYREAIHLFQQSQLPRIYRDGSVRHVDGQVEYATSGHGDFVEALQTSGLLAAFQAQGGKVLLFSNIDNLGATVDPVLIGMHLQSGKEMTIEVAAKAPGDKGGAPARVADRLQIVEEFLFPVHFDQDQITVFNTASYLFQVEALTRDCYLPWYVVEKKVEGQTVLQFEHLAGDLSRELSLCCLEVERDERFLPVKRMEDADTVRPLIARKFGRS